MKLFLLRWYGWSTRRTPHWVPSFLCAMQIIPKNQESEHGLGYINLTASNRLFLTTVLFYGWSVISTTSNLHREKEKGLTQLQTTRTLVTAADIFLLSSWITGALQQIVDIYTVGILSNLQPADDILPIRELIIEFTMKIITNNTTVFQNRTHKNYTAISSWWDEMINGIIMKSKNYINNFCNLNFTLVIIF